jgi:hypothetical protein
VLLLDQLEAPSFHPVLRLRGRRGLPLHAEWPIRAGAFQRDDVIHHIAGAGAVRLAGRGAWVRADERCSLRWRPLDTAVLGVLRAIGAVGGAYVAWFVVRGCFALAGLLTPATWGNDAFRPVACDV